LQSLESTGTKSVVNVDSRKHVEERALEKEEEDYFNEDRYVSSSSEVKRNQYRINSWPLKSVFFFFLNFQL